MTVPKTVCLTPDIGEARSVARTLRSAGIEVVVVGSDAGRVDVARVLVPADQARAAADLLGLEELPDEPEELDLLEQPVEPVEPPPAPEVRPARRAVRRREPAPEELSTVDERLDGLTAELRRQWPWWAIVGPVAVLGTLSFVVAEGMTLFAPLALVWSTLLSLWSPTDVVIDAHAIAIGRRRMLWEDLDEVRIDGDWIVWRLRDGTGSRVRVPMSDHDRDRLQAAIAGQTGRARAPRDRDAEAAVRRLTER